MKRIIEITKNILLVFLSVTMLALWIAYIALNFDSSNDTVNSELESTFWVYSSNETAPSDTIADENFFSPSSVSIILSGKGYTSAFDEKLTDTLYSNCKTLIKEIFSQSYTCAKSDYSHWQDALSCEDAILVEYPYALPYNIIALFAQKTDAYCTGEICYIQKIIFYSDESNFLTALALDSNSNVFSFIWSNPEASSFIYDFNSNNLAAYTVNEGFTEFKFNFSNNAKSFENLPSEYKLLSVAPDLPTISVLNPLSDALDAVFGEEDKSYLEIVSQKELSVLLDAFEINPNIVGYYSSQSTGLTFIGEEMRLSISPSGKISYETINKNSTPITTASLLNTARTDFTLSQILSSATSFISRFSEELLGGDAQAILSGISYISDTNEFVFSFSYHYSLAQIAGKAKTPITLRFNSTGLTSATILPLSIYKYSGDIDVDDSFLTADIVPSVAARLSSSEDLSLSPIYVFDEYAQPIIPLWANRRYEQ